MKDAPATYGIDAQFCSGVNIKPARYFKWKPWFDRPLAVLLAIAFAPVIIVVAVVVRLSSRGGAIFYQVRTGKNGRSFTMFKFRTMSLDAEKHTGAVWCEKNDVRITRVGYWLRKLHLDELPQLWNVARGEMSFVGPRPERPEIIVNLIEHVPGYLDRLAVLPGITGLAQINLPPDQTIEDVKQKQQLDILYILTANWWLDTRAMIATGLRLFGLSDEFVFKVLQLHCDVESFPVEPGLAKGQTRIVDSSRDDLETPRSKTQAVPSEELAAVDRSYSSN